ncbi:MAG: hypothetical protein AB7I38_13410 [Dehalococcoidia bacterium]
MPRHRGLNAARPLVRTTLAITDKLPPLLTGDIEETTPHLPEAEVA